MVVLDPSRLVALPDRVMMLQRGMLADRCTDHAAAAPRWTWIHA